MKRVFRSAAGELLQSLRVAITFDLDLRDGAVDLAQIVRRQLYVGGADVLLEPERAEPTYAALRETVRGSPVVTPTRPDGE